MRWPRLRNLFKRSAPPFDPSLLGDPLAMRTQWTPAKAGGASFRTHNLVMVDSLRMEFRPSPGARLFAVFFILVGAASMGFACLTLARQSFVLAMGSVVPFLFGALFTGVGGVMLRHLAVPVVFDKARGYYWQGRGAPYEIGVGEVARQWARLDDIHAIQLIAEYCTGNDSSFYSYELNLVLKDGGRLNVIDHGNREALREQAATLSQFLGRPVWDAIGL